MREVRIPFYLKPKFIMGAIIGVMTMSTVFGSFYTVNEGYRGVVTTNGAFAEVVEPGLRWKKPFIDTVYDMSVQENKHCWDNIAAYSKDIQQSKNSVCINFSLRPERVGEVYSKLGTGYVDRVVPNNLNDRFKQVFGTMSAADIIAKRDTVADHVEDALRKDLDSYGIDLKDLQITNIDFSDDYERANEAAAKAEANVRTAKQELERVKVDAERQVADALAKAQATKATAEAEAYAVNIRGEAMRKNPSVVELIDAEARAAAVQKWDGNLPQTMVPGSAVPFIGVK